MPFPKQTPRQFTKQNILNITPGQTGCYGLLHQNSWVYVGKGDIRDRLLAHYNGDNPCISRERPTHWVDVVVNNPDQLEKKLILELQPVCNKKVG